ncbi:Oxygen-insensitive NAD(P)H nitroreductase / Dihydropteridine reductase [Methylophaga frappieri]|uniref:Oxygen-insensitive NAD(P)H nitroreductase / Dihydropteridine reductase n=1 Tax=Methylophaga frappieri (strain ATCC BAA-2434 / DSM 25690 / JAM7) TaxID=754477 RepID=I1YEF1_METFJ|nr:nitroreductase family protein [Methylophaga frappieri]AFJ01294.1 Oxygen-insensitive NAD(P)H nitroreductase / Dihydropteridine reductase [Methylophaga frappieri]
MDVKQAIQSRRSIKHYDPTHQMTEAEIEELMSHAILSPTAFNIQHWRFVRVQDMEKRQQILEAAWGQAQVVESSLLLVLCADLNAWEKQPERYWQHAPKSAQEMILPAIENYYTNHHQGQRDECIRSASIAAMNIMLMAKAMGYDTCPMDGFDFDKVARIINLPHDHIIIMMITVGKKRQDAWPRPGQLALEDVFVTDTF